MDDDVFFLPPLVPPQDVLDLQLDTEGIDVDDLIGFPADLSGVLFLPNGSLLVGGIRPLMEELMVILLAAENPTDRLRTGALVSLNRWSQAAHATQSSPSLDLSQSWFSPLLATGGDVSGFLAESASQPKLFHVLTELVLSHGVVVSYLIEALLVSSGVWHPVKKMVMWQETPSHSAD